MRIHQEKVLPPSNGEVSAAGRSQNKTSQPAVDKGGNITQPSLTQGKLHEVWVYTKLP